MLHRILRHVKHEGRRSQVAKRKCGMQDTGQERDERDLKEILDIAAKADAVGDADHAYTCVLTMEPFRDPVTTPDGNSYERSALLEHLKQVRCHHCKCLKTRTLVTVPAARARRRMRTEQRAVRRHMMAVCSTAACSHERRGEV